MIIDTSVFIPGSGNPDTAYEVISNAVGAPGAYAPGDLGKFFPSGAKIYRKVQLDAGAKPTVPGQVLYWKDRAALLVTNVAEDALLPGAPPAAKEPAKTANGPHERVKHEEPKKEEPKKDAKADPKADPKAAPAPADEPPPVPDSNRNNVAGVARGVIPPGSQFFIVVIGTNVPVLEAGAAVGGMFLVANSGENADALGVAVGTPAAFQKLGTVMAPTVDGLCMADLNVGD